jgi:hypothetical protein
MSILIRTPSFSIAIIGGTSRWDADHAYHFRERATVLLINIYRTPVSGVLRRKDSGFAVCGENLASVSQFVAGIRHGDSFNQDAAVASPGLCKNGFTSRQNPVSSFYRGTAIFTPRSERGPLQHLERDARFRGQSRRRLKASRSVVRAAIVEGGARRAAPPAPGATQLGHRARGVVSFPYAPSHGRGA